MTEQELAEIIEMNNQGRAGQNQIELLVAEVRRLKAINKELADWWDATNPWRDDEIEASKAVRDD